MGEALDLTAWQTYNILYHSLVAQLAEQSAVNRWVVGSSPTRGAFVLRELLCLRVKIMTSFIEEKLAIRESEH